jgi:hypothetical protein
MKLVFWLIMDQTSKAKLLVVELWHVARCLLQSGAVLSLSQRKNLWVPRVR